MNRTAAVTIGTVLTALLGAAACDSRASGDASNAARSGKKDDKGNNGSKAERAAAQAETKRGKFKLGRIDSKSIAESSGLAASRKHPGVYWTHNDSGNGPYVFAIQQDGHFLAEFPVASARNTDWEAIAIDDQGRLFVADIGNNDLKRDRALVYRLDEPDPATALRGKGAPLRVGQLLRLKYPDKPFDAESFFVFQGKGYLISKVLTGKHAGVYRFDLAAAGAGADATTLEHVCDLPIRSPVTDAAISDDGKRLAVMTVTGPNVFQIDGDVANAAKVTPAYVNYFDAKDMNMEGVCFTPEGLLASTEQGQMLMFGYELFAEKK